MSQVKRFNNILQEFSQLEDNWCGRGSCSPKEITIQNTRILLRQIKEEHLNLLIDDDFTPSPYGTISIDFIDQLHDELSLEVGKDSFGMCGEIQGQEIIVEPKPIEEFKNFLHFFNDLKVK